MTPDSNNVYGRVVTPTGLGPVLRAMQRLVGEGRVSIDTSQFDGAETLHFSTGDADFESTPLGDGSHLLNGGVGGTPDELVAFVRAMSQAFAEAGIDHRFEVYDDQHNLVGLVPQ